MTIKEKEIQIVDDFAMFDDTMDKYEHLIDIGNEMEILQGEYKIDSFLVKGCQSKVWLVARENKGQMYFSADSNTAIVKGIVGLLVDLINGQRMNEVLSYDFGIIAKIGLQEMLSSQRSNGLVAMIHRIKEVTKICAQTQDV